MGTATSRLMATPKNVLIQGKDKANVNDHVAIQNVPGFGRCRSLAYPPTASATAANHGRLTPMPCIPGTCFKWQIMDSNMKVCGVPALLEASKLQCQYGGTISILGAGQSLVSKNKVTVNRQVGEQTNVEQQSLDQFHQKFSGLNVQGLDSDSVFDGIQTALDVLGMAPGVGAVPDLMNAAISVVRGDWTGAGLSLAAAVPGVGDAIGGAKIALKGAKKAKVAKLVANDALDKQVEKYVGREISKKELLDKGICKTEADAEDFFSLLREKRRKVAEDFYKKHGERDIESHVNGINLDKPVRIKKMPPPHEVFRYDDPERSENSIGSYFGVSSKSGNHINTPRDYGAQPVVKKKDGRVIRKQKRRYQVEESAHSFEYLETTSSAIPAPMDDNWKSAKGNCNNWRPTRGGAIQVFIPNQSKKFLSLMKRVS